MKKHNEDLTYFILLSVLIILAILPTYGHHGNFLIDCGREVYYPTQILNGKVLYKDLFNIYGPLSYMLNAGLFKFFGVHLNVLYLSGCVSAFFITNLIYLIAKRFMTKFLSFCLAVFTIVIGVLNLNLFNFIFPYSYAMLYGLVLILLSIFLLLKYQEDPEKIKYFYLSCFFAGCSITSKYEFLPYLLVLLYSALKTKKLPIKKYFLSFLSLAVAPFICFGILFLQGLRLDDLISTASVLKAMTQSQTLKYFYLSQGVYFNKQTIPFFIINFLMTTIPMFIFYKSVKIKNKFVAVLAISLALILIAFLSTPAIFIFLPLLIFILSIINFKKISKNPPLLILILANFLISLKVFWGLATITYGAYFISLNAITFLALIIELKKDISIDQKVLGTYFLVLSVIFSLQNIYKLTSKTYPLTSNKGTIYIDNQYHSATIDLLNYINQNTKYTDSVIIYPEGTFINFLTDRKTDNYYNSLIPLYFETTDENRLIQNIKKTKPKYIIFNNWNMSKDYYFSVICNDYANKFCSFVSQNYTHQKTIDKGFRYLIYKIKY